MQLTRPYPNSFEGSFGIKNYVCGNMMSSKSTAIEINMHFNKKGWKEFLRLCTKIDSAEELGNLFDLFLTIEEKETLASRYLIIKSLVEGNLTQREIAETCKVSIAQITRGSNALKIISPQLRDLLKSKLK